MVLTVLMVGLSACARTVEVDLPEPDPATRAVCRQLSRQLPGAAAGEEARETTPASVLVTAWGDPPIVLRCGVPEPEALEPTSQVFRVNGVDWFPEELTAGYVFTTTGRGATVEVTVPDDYAPEAGVLTDLAAAIKETNPVDGR